MTSIKLWKIITQFINNKKLLRTRVNSRNSNRPPIILVTYNFIVKVYCSGGKQSSIPLVERLVL